MTEELEKVQTFYYIGLAIAALVAGWVGYKRKPKAHEEEPKAFVGAVVDSRALGPLIDSIEKLRVTIEKSQQREEREAHLAEIRDKLDSDRKIEELMRRLEDKETRRNG